MIRFFLTLCYLSSIFLFAADTALAQSESIAWKMMKSEHFMAEYPNNIPREWIQSLLKKSEYYYDIIPKTIGYARYQNYWTWSDRVTIKVFPTKKQFHKETGIPIWALAGATRDKHVIDGRWIVTYYQEVDFFDGVLPHEITHLMMHDFLASANVPMWFEEGIAQLHESRKKIASDKLSKVLLKQNKLIPIDLLHKMDIRLVDDKRLVMAFYLQSLSITRFLITKYGSQRFGTWLRGLKNGKDFETALSSAYSQIFSELLDVEKKWHRYLRNEIILQNESLLNDS